jgi:4-alpha-glucanotransferase
VGLNVGAPPDLFNPQGQNWGLTTFAPWTLRTAHFAPFLATVRAATRHAGGVRIDHAMGLTRLWLVPEGASPAEGAYLAYPCTDFLRLIRLESHRHRAIVIAEDLGTVPDGFRTILRTPASMA